MRLAFGALILGLVVWFLVVPQFKDAEDAFNAIAHVNFASVGVGAALVAFAIAAQAELTRSVLTPPERPTLSEMLRIELATTAVSHTVPGGTAAGTALAYRLLTKAGVSGPSTGFALGVRGIGSALVLNAILWLALLISIPTQGFDPRYTTAALLGLALFALVGGLLVGLLRAQKRTTAFLHRLLRPVPFLNEARVPDVLESIAEQVRSLLENRPVARRAVVWSAVYWLGLAAALWVLLRAFGWAGPPVSVLVAFGIVNVLAVVPITPRGLGVVEAVLIPMLVGFGAPADAATLGVIGWRLLSFWIPIPLGTISYVSLRISEPEVKAVSRARIASELGEAIDDERARRQQTRHQRPDDPR